MTTGVSLHALSLCACDEIAVTIARALEAVFPASRLAVAADSDGALELLDGSAFDLAVLVLGEPVPEHAHLLKRLEDAATPVPVVVLLEAGQEDRFDEIVSESSADWAIGRIEGLSDRTLARLVNQAIRRTEVRFERDHLQRAFKTSMLQYRSLFDEVPDVIFVCDRSGCLLDINATAERVFDLPKSRMLLKPVFEVLGMDRDAFDSLARAAARDQGPIEDLEITFYPPGGTAVHGLAHLIPMRDAPGRQTRFQGVIKDITRHKELESRLRASEYKHRTLYELARISSSSLDLEQVADRALDLIVARGHAAGALLLLNRRHDELDIVAARNFDPRLQAQYRALSPAQIGQGVVGRWAIAGEVQQIQADQFDALHAVLAEWLGRLGAATLSGCPLGQSNPMAPTSILLLAHAEAEPSDAARDLLPGVAKTLEIGVNNCHHYSAARQAEQKYRELWEDAPAYFISLLRGGAIFEVNQTAARALGYKLPEMIGRPLTDFVAPANRATAQAHHAEVLERGRPVSCEIQLVRRDGEILIASMHSEPLANAEGDLIGEKAVLYDITRDKKLEASLRDYSENLERMVEDRTQELTRTSEFLNGILEGSTELAIFALDVHGTFVHFNRGAQLILHRDPERVVGRCRLDEVIGVDRSDAGSLRALLEQTNRTGVLVTEVRAETGDGRSIVTQLSINRLRTESEGHPAYVGILRDITEQKRLEGLLKQYSENLEQEIESKIRELDQKHVELIQSSKLATLGEMATGIAHELNQPLSGIRTKAQLLARNVSRGKASSEKIVADQKVIIGLVDRITKIIEHMRVFSRQDEAPFAPFNINQSIEGCFSLLGEQLRLHSIDVDVDVPVDPPAIVGEPSQIEQVLLNLAANARDSMAEKEALLREEDPARANEYRKKLVVGYAGFDSGEIRLTISDNGMGIDPEKRERLFEPFFTTKPVGRGTGLGLSISYGIITRHGGRIEIESRPGEGSSFHVFLPTESAASSVHSPAERPPLITQYGP